MSKKNIFCLCLITGLFLGGLYSVRGILFPFVVSFVLAYLLNPLTRRLAQKKRFKKAAPFIVIAGSVLTILAAMMLLIPILQAQIVVFAEKIPLCVSAIWQKITPILTALRKYMDEAKWATLQESFADKGPVIFQEIGKAVASVFSSGMVLFDVATFVVITPVITYYLLADWDKIVSGIRALFPRPYVHRIDRRFKQIDMLLSAFVRGQALVCLSLALFYGTGLTLIGLDLGFAVGFLAGLFSFIPYMGTLTGFIFSLLLAMAQGASWPLFTSVVCVFLVGQFLEGYILTPRLVGDKVGLHPAWIIFALFAGGAAFGFMGILLAVPVFTILKVGAQIAFEAYQKTSFYTGES